jgi:hypothetical protein
LFGSGAAVGLRIVLTLVAVQLLAAGRADRLRLTGKQGQWLCWTMLGQQ